MKKFLLSLATVAMAFTASAASYTVFDIADPGTWNGGADGWKNTVTVDGQVFNFDYNKGSNTSNDLMSPVANTYSWRVYKNTQYVLNASVKMTKIVVTYDNGNNNQYCLEGEYSEGWTAALAGDVLTANNSAAPQTFSFKAVNGQVRIKTIVVEGTPGTMIDPDGGTPATPDEPEEGVIYKDEFKNLDGWTLSHDESLAYTGNWRANSSSKGTFAQCNSYMNGVTNSADCWMTREFDLTEATNVVLSVSQAFGYSFPQTANDNYTLNVRVKGTENWTKYLLANMPAAPESGNWSDFVANEIDLGEWEGEVIELGFRYLNDGNTNCVWEISDFVLRGEGGNNPEPPVSDAVYTGLVDNADGWTFDNITIPEGLTYIWAWDTNYFNLKGSAYYQQAYAGKAYAISPVIDLTAVNDAKVSFDHAAKFQTSLKTLCGFCIREEGAADWTELTIPTWPEAGAWTFANSGDIDLSAYKGKKVQIAFKYESTATECDTWEIKNVIVNGSSSVAAIEANDNAPAVYYNLQGVRVANPENGIFIQVKGGKSSKVAL